MRTNLGAASVIDAARQMVGRIHDAVASVVDREGQGFCWGFATVGSAFPSVFDHGELVPPGEDEQCLALAASTADRWKEVLIRNWLLQSVASDGVTKNYTIYGVDSKSKEADFQGDPCKVQRVTSASVRGGFCGAQAIGVLAHTMELVQLLSRWLHAWPVRLLTLQDSADAVLSDRDCPGLCMSRRRTPSRC